jgi:hypothetical protein
MPRQQATGEGCGGNSARITPEPGRKHPSLLLAGQGKHISPYPPIQYARIAANSSAGTNESTAIEIVRPKRQKRKTATKLRERWKLTEAGEAR